MTAGATTPEEVNDEPRTYRLEPYRHSGWAADRDPGSGDPAPAAEGEGGEGRVRDRLHRMPGERHVDEWPVRDRRLRARARREPGLRVRTERAWQVVNDRQGNR